MVEILFNILFLGTDFLISLIWLWGPIILVLSAVKIWKNYIRMYFISNLERIMLEIRLPREITKSPVAMELFLNHLHQPFGGDLLKDKWWSGSTWSWFSLELVSLGGQVKFFIWTEKKHRKVIETQIYAQYPNVEIVEVDDYAMKTDYDPEKVDLTGAEFKLTTDDEYPIKTYIDYGLDKDPKEEFKIDPISPVLEFLGSLRPGEQAWFQILIRAHKAKHKGFKWLFLRETTSWKDEGKELVKKLAKRDKEREEKSMPEPLTERERSVLESVERNLSKKSFDCGIRGIYIAPKDIFDKGNIAGIAGSWAQYNSNDLNGFKPGGIPGVPYKIQDPLGFRVAKMKRVLFDAYRRRSWFHPPYQRKSFILSTEELATIFHFPGDVIQTPTFERIESKKSEPPQNLPM